MRVAIHLGAHCTDEDRLLKTLLLNKGLLAAEGVSVPGPGRYRKTVLRDAYKLRGVPAGADALASLLASICDDDSARRVILTSENFLCLPARIFDHGMLYDQAGIRPKMLRSLFPGLPVEFFIAIRNPATFIPAAFRHRDQNIADFGAFLDRAVPEDICWSDVIRSIRRHNPECPVTVWCNEDTPLIWPQVIRKISDHGEDTAVQGGDNILATIMQVEGLHRLQEYLKEHPPRNEIQRRRTLLVFLDKYAINDAVEEVLDVPGWTDERVARLTRLYETDIAEIERMNGVRFIAA